MEMTAVHIGILGIVGSILAIGLKSEKAEYGIYVSVAISIFIFYCILSRLQIFTDTLKSIKSYIQFDSVYLNTILKMIGITYVAEFAAGICKDTGYQNIASQIEIFAKLSILALSMPIMLALLEMIQGFLS